MVKEVTLLYADLQIRGDNTPGNPARKIGQLYAKDGELIWEKDPFDRYDYVTGELKKDLDLDAASPAHLVSLFKTKAASEGVSSLGVAGLRLAHLIGAMGYYGRVDLANAECKELLELLEQNHCYYRTKEELDRGAAESISAPTTGD